MRGRERRRKSLRVLEETVSDESSDESEAKEASHDSEEPVKAFDAFSGNGDILIEDERE